MSIFKKQKKTGTDQRMEQLDSLISRIENDILFREMAMEIAGTAKFREQRYQLATKVLLALIEKKATLEEGDYERLALGAAFLADRLTEQLSLQKPPT